MPSLNLDLLIYGTNKSKTFESKTYRTLENFLAYKFCVRTVSIKNTVRLIEFTEYKGNTPNAPGLPKPKNSEKRLHWASIVREQKAKR